MADKNLILCPYCGHTQFQPEDRCEICFGYFDPLSLRITQQHMGPWFVRDLKKPFLPGCSYEVLVQRIKDGKIKAGTIIKGPTTKQYWSVAQNVPGVSHLIGYCYNCGSSVQPTEKKCHACNQPFITPENRDRLGLAPKQNIEDILKNDADSSKTKLNVKIITDTESTDTEPPHVGNQPVVGVYPPGSTILANLRDTKKITLADQSTHNQITIQPSTSTNAPDSSTDNPTADMPQPTSTLSRAKLWLLIIVNLIMLAILAAIIITVMNNYSQQSDTDTKPDTAAKGIVTTTPPATADMH